MTSKHKEKKREKKMLAIGKSTLELSANLVLTISTVFIFYIFFSFSPFQSFSMSDPVNLSASNRIS